VALELGCGASALASLVLARIAAVRQLQLEIVATDKESGLLEFARMNAALNNLDAWVSFEELSWGQHAAADWIGRRGPAGLVLAADVVYSKHCYCTLVETLVASSDAHTQLVLACKSRSVEEEHFFHLLSAEFEPEHIAPRLGPSEACAVYWFRRRSVQWEPPKCAFCESLKNARLQQHQQLLEAELSSRPAS
jgi:hypothetical protein